MSFNEKLPEWLAPGTEPPESKKVSGWAPADKPPADYFNWLFHRAYLALKELQEKAAAKLNFDNHVNDNKKHPLYGVTTGTANAYVISFSPQPTGYTDGMEVVLKLHSDSKAGASTININNLGAKPLKKANGYDATNLKTNGIYTFRYNATTGNFILQGEGGTGNAIPSDVLLGKTFSNDAGEQTGTMQNHGAKGVIMPKTARQNFGAGYYQEFSVEGDPDLIEANILLGKNIFGVNGSAKPYPTKLRFSQLGMPKRPLAFISSKGSSSRIAGDDSGNVYLFSSNLYKLDTNLADVWSKAFREIDWVSVSPLNRLYVYGIAPNASVKKLHEVNKSDGSVIWSTDLELAFESSGISIWSSAYDSAGNLYVGVRTSSFNNAVIKYSPNGVELWRKTLWSDSSGAHINGLSIIGSTVYAGGNKWYKLSTLDGAFTIHEGSNVGNNMVTDGTYLYMLIGTSLCKYDTSFQMIWTFSLDNRNTYDLDIYNGNLYVRSQGTYTVVSPSGSQLEYDNIFSANSYRQFICVLKDGSIVTNDDRVYKLPEYFTVTN